MVTCFHIFNIDFFWGVNLMNENVHIGIKDIVHNCLVIRYNAY